MPPSPPKFKTTFHILQYFESRALIKDRIHNIVAKFLRLCKYDDQKARIMFEHVNKIVDLTGKQISSAIEESALTNLVLHVGAL